MNSRNGKIVPAKKLLITGSNGFIGRNLQSQLSLQPDDYDILTYSRDSTEKLETLLDEADFIFHLAGVNRPQNDDEFRSGNFEFTQKIVDYLIEKERDTPILYTSSIQAELDNPYGKSKLSAEQYIDDYARNANTGAYILRLPNVFGKWSRPNYNSAIATFCHNLTHNLPITINNPEASLRLIYIDDVVKVLISCLEDEVKPVEIPSTLEEYTFSTTVGQVASKLTELVDIRKSLVVPDLSQKLTKYLYSTLTSFYDQDDLTYDLTVNSDERGWLFELTKSDQFGQVFISQTKPGYTRGDHWHHTKVEKFCVIQGEGEVFFRDFDSDEVFSYKLTGEKVQVIDIPVGYIHAVKNTGKTDMLLAIWASEILDKSRPDTYYEKVVKDESK